MANYFRVLLTQKRFRFSAKTVTSCHTEDVSCLRSQLPNVGHVISIVPNLDLTAALSETHAKVHNLHQLRHHNLSQLQTLLTSNVHLANRHSPRTTEEGISETHVKVHSINITKTLQYSLHLSSILCRRLTSNK